jgi:large subunit ribosomal protein L25
MANDTTTLAVTPRDREGSRANRRLRRTGRIPAVIYGGGEDPVHFSIDARELRVALQAAGAVIELSLDGKTTNAVVKDVQRHPVRNETLHVDFVRVRMDVAIQTTVLVELTGTEEAGDSDTVLEQQTREVTVEALPGDIPESIVHDASTMEVGQTLHVSDLKAPDGVTIVDDPETVVASLTLPRLEVETPDEVETETEVVGEGEGEAAATGEEAEGAPQTGDAGGDGDS